MTNSQHRAQMVALLEGFRAMYDEAELVFGHYITRHDLPIINGGMVEWGLPLLGSKLVHDTKQHLRKFSEIPKTQEHLSDMMATAEAKLHMKQSMWREANRLTVEGLAETRSRVVGDVQQNIALRAALLERDLLDPPQVWRP